MSNRRLFFITFFVTTALGVALPFLDRMKQAKSRVLKLVALDTELYVTSQLRPAQIRNLHLRGFGKIIDFRPDGEAPDQPSSAEIEQAAHAEGMTFHYIPVPHESIPGSAIEALGAALESPTRTALYCRTGRRAVRTYALLEASRDGARDLPAILRLVHDAGFTADDLSAEIAQRIARRANQQAAQN